MIQLYWAKPKAKAKAKPKAKPRAKAKPKAKPKAKAKTKGKGNAKGEATGKGNGKGNGVLSANCFSAIVYSFVPLHWRPGKASLTCHKMLQVESIGMAGDQENGNRPKKGGPNPAPPGAPLYHIPCAGQPELFRNTGMFCSETPQIGPVFQLFHPFPRSCIEGT